MNEPAWVTLLFDRGNGWQATQGPFLYSLMRELIHEHCGDDESRVAELRTASLRRLDDDSYQALAFLSVVGLPSDLPIAERFLSSSHESVRNAAKICKFELSRKRG